MIDLKDGNIGGPIVGQEFFDTITSQIHSLFLLYSSF